MGWEWVHRPHLFSKSKTAEEKAHAQNQKQVGEDRANKRCLDNSNLVLIFQVRDFLQRQAIRTYLGECNTTLVHVIGKHSNEQVK